MNLSNQNQRIVAILLILPLLFVAACGRNEGKPTPKAPLLLQGSGQELNPYIEGVVALSQDDFEKAKTAFLGFAPALQKKGTPEAANLGKLALTIASATDIREMRQALKPLSKSVATYIEGAGVKGFTAYYCPHKNGYWLSTAMEVENPYAGAEMFHCGQQVNRVQ